MYVLQHNRGLGLALILMLMFIIGGSQACPSSGCDRRNCQWSSWSNQGSCNTGYQTQTRYKAVAEKCGGSCSGSTTRRVYMRTNCVWGSWGSWGSCSGNRQYRYRSKTKTEKCGGSCSGSSRMSKYSTCRPATTCGIRKVSLSGLRPAIYHGTDVYPPGKWPWMVTVNSGVGFCGGAIIAKNWVLTAGHCVYGSSVRSTYVRAGRHNLDTSESTQQTRYASQIVIHPDYKYVSRPFKLINDFALIKLTSDFVYNDRVQPICVATSTYGLSGCHSIGWGLTSPTDTRSGGVLQEVPVSVASSTACKQRYSYYNWIDSGKVLCVNPSSDAKICSGDSGSPLVCKKSNGQYFTLGPASFARSGCSGSTDINSAYGDVTKIVSFIRQKCANCI